MRRRIDSEATERPPALSERDASDVNPTITIPLKRFLLLSACPAAFQACDLYLFRDGATVFYVGQSANVYERVWEHVLGGFKGRSTVGLFILGNWPRSLSFEIQLLRSDDPCFNATGHTPDAAERYLIETLHPCFNTALNDAPAPLPRRYRPPDASGPRPRGLKRMIHAAEQAVARDEARRGWDDN
jgi:hypothetical protein